MELQYGSPGMVLQTPFRMVVHSYADYAFNIILEENAKTNHLVTNVGTVISGTLAPFHKIRIIAEPTRNRVTVQFYIQLSYTSVPRETRHHSKNI